MRRHSLVLMIVFLNFGQSTSLGPAAAEPNDAADKSRELSTSNPDVPAAPFTLEWTQVTPMDAQRHVWDYIEYLPRLNRLIAVEIAADGIGKRNNATFTLWEFSEQGKLISKVLLAKPPPETIIPLSGGRILDAVALPDGELLIIAKIDNENTTSLLRLSQDRTKISTKALPKKLLGSQFYKGVTFQSDQLLLVGVQEQPMVVCIDFKGNVVWARSYDRPKTMDWFTDVIVMRNRKNFIVAGQSGHFNKFGGGPSDVWLLRCDADGKVVDEKLFPGRTPHIAGPLEGGGVGMIFDLRNDIMSDQSVALVDASLNVVWQKSADISATMAERPAIAQAGHDHFVIADITTNQLRVRQYDLHGNIVKNYRKAFGDGDRTRGSVRVAVHGDRVFVGTDLLQVKEATLYGFGAGSE